MVVWLRNWKPSLDELSVRMDWRLWIWWHLRKLRGRNVGTHSSLSGPWRNRTVFWSQPDVANCWQSNFATFPSEKEPILQNSRLSCPQGVRPGSQEGLEDCSKMQTSTQFCRTYWLPSWPGRLNNWEAKTSWRKFTACGDGVSDSSWLFPLHFPPKGRLYHLVSE